MPERCVWRLRSARRWGYIIAHSFSSGNDIPGNWWSATRWGGWANLGSNLYECRSFRHSSEQNRGGAFSKNFRILGCPFVSISKKTCFCVFVHRGSSLAMSAKGIWQTYLRNASLFVSVCFVWSVGKFLFFLARRRNAPCGAAGQVSATIKPVRRVSLSLSNG